MNGAVKCIDMAHGINTSVKRSASGVTCKTEGKAGIGSRRIFAPQFKLQVLDSYRNDVDCKGNQRATARKYGIHRRQIQKWLQVENNLRNSVIKSKSEVSASNSPEARKCGFELALRNCDLRQRDDVSREAYGAQQRQQDTGAELELSGVRLAGCAGPRGSPQPDKRVPDAGAHAAHHIGGEDRRVPEINTYPYEYERPWRCSSPKCEISSPSCSPRMYIEASPELGPYGCECPESALPLDFTVRRADAGSPIDLSVRRCPRNEPPFAPVPPPQLTAPFSIHADRPPTCLSPDSQIWDLSTKGTKRPHGDTSRSPDIVSSSVQIKREMEPKPVKLFKPYLLDDDNSCDNKSAENCQFDLGYSNNKIFDSEYYYNNNNEYFYKDDAYKGYYYPVCPDYYPGNVHYIDDKNNYFKKNQNFAKQRQSYSLDFKLSAIQCYYSDENCKGNQRAVATKYKIHRRQVQKWLKQEDELRQRIETTKHMHIVTKVELQM